MYLLRIHWGFGEHRCRGHAKVALCIIRRYVPLIHEEKLDLAPRHFRLQQRVVCQQSVQCFRRGTTRERDAERVLFSDGLPRCLQEFRGSRLRNTIGVRQDSDFSIVRHNVSAFRHSPAPVSPEPHSARTTTALFRSFAMHAHPAPAIRRKRAVVVRAERSEEHTSELQSPDQLVCRLLLEKKTQPAPALRYPARGLSASLPLAARAHRFRPS